MRRSGAWAARRFATGFTASMPRVRMGFSTTGAKVEAASGLRQASLRLTDRPPNITLIPLPAKCPELNLQENVRQFMRDNWLSNRCFKFFDDIIDHCCGASNKFVD